MKRLLSILLTLALLLSLTACGGGSGASAPQEGGDTAADAEPEDAAPAEGEDTAPAERSEDAPGEEAEAGDGYIHIASFEDFTHIADDLSGRYILDADISGWGDGPFTPIGTVETPFSGELNGNGHSISGDLLYTGEEPCWGLFIYNTGSIHDLTLGTLTCDAMYQREAEYFDEERTYADFAGLELPEEQTMVYGLLCGANAGTIEHITVQDFATLADFNLLRNANSGICIGGICGYNGGTIRDVHMASTQLTHRTMDGETQVDVGLVCGRMTEGGSIEQVSLSEAAVVIGHWYGNGVQLNIAPCVSAGLVVGDAERESVIRDVTLTDECQVTANYSLEDAELYLGGVIGNAEEDITLENVDACVFIKCDARDDLEGYEAQGSGGVHAGGLIGCAEDNCTLRACTLRGSTVHTITRPYDRGDSSYTGGMVGYCGGELVAEGLTVTESLVDADASDRDVYLGGLCGLCSGNVTVSDSDFGVATSIGISDRCEVFNSNVLGYGESDVTFKNVTVNCGSHENNGGEGVTRATYYFAALAAGVEGEFSAEGCTIDVLFSPFVGNATIYGAEDYDGMYNPA